MLTQERLDALSAVKAGTVKARKASAPGSPTVFTPQEMTVALGYLQKAQLVYVETERLLVAAKVVPRCRVLITERGEHALVQNES